MRYASDEEIGVWGKNCFFGGCDGRRASGGCWVIFFGGAGRSSGVDSGREAGGRGSRGCCCSGVRCSGGGCSNRPGGEHSGAGDGVAGGHCARGADGIGVGDCGRCREATAQDQSRDAFGRVVPAGERGDGVLRSCAALDGGADGASGSWRAERSEGEAGDGWSRRSGSEERRGSESAGVRANEVRAGPGAGDGSGGSRWRS